MACPYCGPYRALLVEDAIAHARPDRHIVLTLASKVFALTGPRVGRFFDRLNRARAGKAARIRAAWVLEIGEDPELAHVHIAARAPTLHVPDIEETAAITGFGSAFIRSLPTGPSAFAAAERRNVGRYLLKEILKAPLGSEAAADGLSAHLSRNGNRLVHSSQGFFLDDAGASITMSEAVRLERARHQL